MKQMRLAALAYMTPERYVFIIRGCLEGRKRRCDHRIALIVLFKVRIKAHKAVSIAA